MNRNALIEVRDSVFSSTEAKLAAEIALFEIDNPNRPAYVEPTDPTTPAVLPKYGWFAALADSTISDEGSPARLAWIAGADLWLKSIVENSQYSTDQKIEAQARHTHYTAPRSQRYAEEAAEQAAPAPPRPRLKMRSQRTYKSSSSFLTTTGSEYPVDPSPLHLLRTRRVILNSFLKMSEPRSTYWTQRLVVGGIALWVFLPRSNPIEKKKVKCQQTTMTPHQASPHQAYLPGLQ